MNSAEAYKFCCNYHGKRVRINCKDGKVHVGKITRVDKDQVWILPDRQFGGYGLGYWGFRGPGFGYGIAIGAIAGIALAPLFFF